MKSPGNTTTKFLFALALFLFTSVAAKAAHAQSAMWWCYNGNCCSYDPVTDHVGQPCMFDCTEGNGEHYGTPAGCTEGP
jgi:hypothetical protein